MDWEEIVKKAREEQAAWIESELANFCVNDTMNESNYFVADDGGIIENNQRAKSRETNANDFSIEEMSRINSGDTPLVFGDAWVKMTKESITRMLEFCNIDPVPMVDKIFSQKSSQTCSLGLNPTGYLIDEGLNSHQEDSMIDIPEGVPGPDFVMRDRTKNPYRMNPETEDLIYMAENLRPGMKVFKNVVGGVLADWFTILDMDCCKCGTLDRCMYNYRLVVQYDDGHKDVIKTINDSSWYVKKDSLPKENDNAASKQVRPHVTINLDA